jgi:hypothetical protein
MWNLVVVVVVVIVIIIIIIIITTTTTWLCLKFLLDFTAWLGVQLLPVALGVFHFNS